MQDLQEVTQEVHYENYRSERLAKGVKKSTITASNDDSQTITNVDKDRALLEKDAELRRMHEMLAQMQAKMASPN